MFLFFSLKLKKEFAITFPHFCIYYNIEAIILDHMLRWPLCSLKGLYSENDVL